MPYDKGKQKRERERKKKANATHRSVHPGKVDQIALGPLPPPVTVSNLKRSQYY